MPRGVVATRVQLWDDYGRGWAMAKKAKRKAGKKTKPATTETEAPAKAKKSIIHTSHPLRVSHLAKKK
jgi:hypothetical protein